MPRCVERWKDEPRLESAGYGLGTYSKDCHVLGARQQKGGKKERGKE